MTKSSVTGKNVEGESNAILAFDSPFMIESIVLVLLR